MFQSYICCNTLFFLIFLSFCTTFSDGNDQDYIYQSFKLEILDTSAFSVTFRFQNLKFSRTEDNHYFHCVQVRRELKKMYMYLVSNSIICLWISTPTYNNISATLYGRFTKSWSISTVPAIVCSSTISTTMTRGYNHVLTVSREAHLITSCEWPCVGRPLRPSPSVMSTLTWTRHSWSECLRKFRFTWNQWRKQKDTQANKFPKYVHAFSGMHIHVHVLYF